MRGFLYKDLLNSRFALGSAGVFTLIFAAVYMAVGINEPDPENSIFLMAVCVYASFYISNLFNSELFKKDENRCYFSFAVSAPQGVRGQVMSKYVFLMLENLAIVFVFLMADFILVAIKDDMAVSGGMVTMIIFCFQTLMNSLAVPFMSRFGSDKGITLKGGAVMALILAAGIYMLYGDLSLFGDDLTKRVMEFFKSPAIIWALSLFPYFAALCYYLSYKISLKVYRKGIETYE